MDPLSLAAIVIGGVAAFGGLIATHYRRAGNEQAHTAARALNLQLSYGKKLTPVLSGVVEGRPLEVVLDTFSLRVEVRGLREAERLAFTAKRSTPERERMRPAHLRDIEVGDRELDDRWTLDGANEGVVRALFSRAEVQRYLEVWRKLTLTPEGTLTVERLPEPGPDVIADIQRALALASLLEALADVGPIDAPRVAEALLEARGIGGESGAPVPVPSLARRPRRRLFRRR